MKVISSVYWDKGKRSNNQDSLILEQVLTSRGRVVLAAISDGIGGLAEGEVASGFIMEKLLQNFYSQILLLIGKRKGMRFLEKSLLRCFFETGQMLRQYAQSREIMLGATVTVLLIVRNRFLIAHLGDSRIYRFWGKDFFYKKRIKLISKDHSDGKNVLKKCLGSFSFQSPDIYKGRISKRTGFLLCSDGFYHYLSDHMLSDLLNPQEINCEEKIGKRLRELARYESRQGEEDNISAVYILCGQ